MVVYLLDLCNQVSKKQKVNDLKARTSIFFCLAECIGGKTYNNLNEVASSSEAISKCQDVGSTLVSPRSQDTVQVIKDATGGNKVDTKHDIHLVSMMIILHLFR